MRWCTTARISRRHRRFSRSTTACGSRTRRSSSRAEALPEPGALDNAGYGLGLPPGSHDVDAGHASHLANAPDRVDGDLDPGCFRLVALEPLHSTECGLVELDAGDVVVHVPEQAGAARRRHADEHGRALRYPGVDDRREPLGEAVDVVHDVRLEAVDAGVELLLELLDGVHERVGGAGDEEVRRCAQRLAGRETARV